MEQQPSSPSLLISLSRTTLRLLSVQTNCTVSVQHCTIKHNQNRITWNQDANESTSWKACWNMHEFQVSVNARGRSGGWDICWEIDNFSPTAQMLIFLPAFSLVLSDSVLFSIWPPPDVLDYHSLSGWLAIHSWRHLVRRNCLGGLTKSILGIFSD